MIIAGYDMTVDWTCTRLTFSLRLIDILRLSLRLGVLSCISLVSLEQDVVSYVVPTLVFNVHFGVLLDCRSWSTRKLQEFY